jgi:hypothetical protein
MEDKKMSKLTRREFLSIAGTTAAVLVGGKKVFSELKKGNLEK